MTDAALTPASPAPHVQRVMIYSRYERFWHWTQAALILTLAYTGFVVHGTVGGLTFKQAVTVHTFAAMALIVLWVFTIFWHFTTGEWRQFVPRGNLFEIIKFYAYGIFAGAPAPYRKSPWRKQNALQAMTYLGMVVANGLGLWVSGVAYLTYPVWSKALAASLDLQTIALVHTACAFLMVTFVIVHIYIVTTGKTVGHDLKVMLSGYDEVELDPVDEAYLKAHHEKGLR
ncbi:MAG: cytochrome b/b6 domain-containing protein [Methylobacteriaceae bacterium]|nr:cytochrome b/b6 domain-containing protein [Methylobacteriaceae bacterium]